MNVKSLRITLFLGITLYCLFGILDYFMLPQHYQFAWVLRFAIILPLTSIFFLLTFFTTLEKYLRVFNFILLILAQISIMTMLVVAAPEEPAFYGYYVGTIIMLLACEFMFEIPFKPSVFYFIFSLILYLIVAIFDQQLLHWESIQYNKSWLIGNFFFFVGSGLISLAGLYRLLKSRDEARQANILKSSFLANISHEIRTPLNGITGCSKLLTTPALSDEDKIRFSKVITASSDQLLDIVDSILTMSSIETGHNSLDLTYISLSDFLYEITQLFIFQAEQKRIDFIVENLIEKNQNDFYTDQRKLRMILNNLLMNALKFTEFGTITLKAGFTSAGLRLIVEDTGIGFSDDQSEKIFESFYQINKGYSREYGGNGLGLAICKSYCSMLDGTIKAESVKNMGAVFTVTLPVLEG